jgi:hypothetical protein
MGFPSFRFLYIFLPVLLLSCTQDNLIGTWKPVSTRFISKMQKDKTPVFDLIKTDSLRSVLYAEILQNQEPGATDTAAILKEVDATIKHWQGSSVTINSDTTFFMVSNGFIFPVAIPGWHFGDTLTGSWSKKNADLTLSIGDETHGFSVRYQIMKLDKDSLILREILFGTNGEPTREITFQKK